MCEHHEGVPWQPPAKLPPPADLMNALGACYALIECRATPEHAKRCLAKMVVAFEPNTKLSGDDMRLRAAVWLEANGDLSDGLWAEATLQAIRTCTWTPKPAEFRAFVEPRVAQARAMKWKIEEMLRKHNDPDPVFTPEPWDVRMRGMIAAYRKVGRLGRAAQLEHQLAEAEKREPEAWAVGVSPEHADTGSVRDPDLRAALGRLADRLADDVLADVPT